MDVGTVIAGKWKLGQLLGEGGMGSVYAAVHVRNGRRAAIKFLHANASSDVRARFHAEGFAANQVDHPGTVQVLDDGADGDQPFLVMELLDGISLEAMAEANGGVLSVATIAPYISQVLEVLAAAHAKDIVHRDVKPENILVTRQGRAKLLDFGIARVASPRDAKLTISGVSMGTPAYMAPEQALAMWDEVDGRTDVFSVGASVWACLTGKLLFEARTAAELLVFMSTKQARPISDLLPGLSSDVASIVDKALSFDRMKRFADAAEMLVAWNQACARMGLSASLNPWGQARESTVDQPQRHADEAGVAAQLTLAAHPTISGITTGHRRRTQAPSRVLLWSVLAMVVVGVGVGLYAFRVASPSEDPAAHATAPEETSAPGNSGPVEAPPKTQEKVPSVEPVRSASAVLSQALSASASPAPSAEPKRSSPGIPTAQPRVTQKPTSTAQDPFRF